MLVRRSNKMASVNADWQNMIKGTEVKAKTVSIVLLKSTIMKELAMYVKMDGQCMFRR